MEIVDLFPESMKNLQIFFFAYCYLSYYAQPKSESIDRDDFFLFDVCHIQVGAFVMDLFQFLSREPQITCLNARPL